MGKVLSEVSSKFHTEGTFAVKSTTANIITVAFTNLEALQGVTENA